MPSAARAQVTSLDRNRHGLSSALLRFYFAGMSHECLGPCICSPLCDNASCMTLCDALECQGHSQCPASMYCANQTAVFHSTGPSCREKSACFVRSDSIDDYCPSGATSRCARVMCALFLIDMMHDSECDDHVDCGAHRYCANGISASGQTIRKCAKLVDCQERRDAVNNQCPRMDARTHLAEHQLVSYVWYVRTVFLMCNGKRE